MTKSLPTFLGAFVLLALSSCTLISKPDDEFVKATFALQSKVDTTLVTMLRTKKEAYSEYSQFYLETEVGLRQLEMRANILRQNTHAQSLVSDLRTQLSELEAMHKDGISDEEIPPLRSGINTVFEQIVRLENEKKLFKTVEKP